MNPENLPKPGKEQYDPNFDAQDEDVVSGGNNRLTYILGGVIVALVLAYVALPKGQGTALSSATPTFMLDDAAVTASVPAAPDSLTAGPEAVPTAPTPGVAPKPQKSEATAAAAPLAGATAAAEAPAVPGAAVSGAGAAAAAPAAAPPTAPQEPAAPTSAALTGHIDDENGHPLVGATVLLKGSSKGTSTDANGNYTLEVPSGTDNTLIYGYGGYNDEVVRSRGSQPVNVTLIPREKTGRKRR